MEKAMTSMRVFRTFLVRSDTKKGDEAIDAEGVISRKCYDLWVATRKTLSSNPEKAFQRSLSAHVTGVDGRVPFTKSEEVAILRVLRRKERWPCFESSSTRFGQMGFRAKGYHEKMGEEKESSSPKSKRVKRTRTALEAEEAEEEEEEHDSPSLRAGDHHESDEGADFKEDEVKNLTSEHNVAGLRFLSLAGNLLSQTLGTATPPQTTVIGLPEDKRLQDPPMNLAEEATGDWNFLSSAGALLSRFKMTGLDSWSTILSLGRMRLFSQGWFAGPSVEQGKEICEQISKEFPAHCVLVLDPVCRQLRDRVVAQNEISLRYLGKVSKDDGGLDHRLVALSDGWTAITTVTRAFRNPGQDIPCFIHLCGISGQYVKAEVYFRVIPDWKILVAHGQVAAN